MARNYYSEIHLHMVWHTKESAPLLTPEVEAVVFRSLKEKIVATEGAYVHALGGTENHVHLSVTVAPTIPISDLIGQLKGFSSHVANHCLGGSRKLLQWQSGYGVVSFGTKNLPWVNAYVLHQKEHHARYDIVARLERSEQREAP